MMLSALSLVLSSLSLDGSRRTLICGETAAVHALLAV